MNGWLVGRLIGPWRSYVPPAFMEISASGPPLCD